MSHIEGKEIAEASLIAYYDYVMRFELNAMVPKMRELMESNPEAELTELVEELMQNINTHIAEDYKVVSLNVLKDLGRRLGEVAKTL